MVKHFINISDFKKNELKKIISFAKKIKNNPSKYNKLLQNKSLGMIFQKQSTRTRISFNIGMKKIGGNVIELDKNAIGFGQRESDLDIIGTLSQYIDCLMIRNDNHSRIIALSKLNLLPIINGLSDFSHPCQILSDIFIYSQVFSYFRYPHIFSVFPYIIRYFQISQKFPDISECHQVVSYSSRYFRYPQIS